MTYKSPAFPGVHLPGSVALPNAEEVFRWAGENFGDWLHRISDGETGEHRMRWIQSQREEFSDNPTLEIVEDTELGLSFGRAKVKAGAEPTFNRLQYADWAKASYEVFSKARETGVLAEHVRFMVAMPHPMDTVWVLAQSAAFEAIYPAYEQQALAAAHELAEAIPHSDLSIQWDIPLGSHVWAESAPNPFASRQELFEALVRTADAVPSDVELGFHLCFGDRAPMPVKGPALAGEGKTLGVIEEHEDSAALASLMNNLIDSVERPIEYFHMPTDRGWLEPRHYEPLAELNLTKGTELHVGVVALRMDGDLPLDEGVARARQRADAARAVLGDVGLSSSCGFGRSTPDQFNSSATLIHEFAAASGA